MRTEAQALERWGVHMLALVSNATAGLPMSALAQPESARSVDPLIARDLEG